MPSWFADKLVLPRILKRKSGIEGLFYTRHIIFRMLLGVLSIAAFRGVILTVDGLVNGPLFDCGWVDNQIELIKEQIPAFNWSAVFSFY